MTIKTIQMLVRISLNLGFHELGLIIIFIATSDHDYQASGTNDKGKGLIDCSDTHTGETICVGNESSHPAANDLKCLCSQNVAIVHRL
jgi:hypothetical protein